MRMKNDERFRDLMEYACDCSAGKKSWNTIDDYAYSRGCTVADLARAIELVKLTGGANGYATYCCVLDRRSMDEFVMADGLDPVERKIMFFVLCLVGMTADAVRIDRTDGDDEVLPFLQDIVYGEIGERKLRAVAQCIRNMIEDGMLEQTFVGDDRLPTLTEICETEQWVLINKRMYYVGEWHDGERAAVMLDQLLFDFNIAYYGALVDTYGLGGLVGRLSRKEYLEMLEADRRYRRVYGTK